MGWIGTLAREALGSARYRMRKAPSPVPPAIEAALRQDGYYLWPEFWDRDRCERARDALDALLDAPEVHKHDDPLGGDRRIFGADRLDPALDLFTDPTLRPIIEGLFRTDDIVGCTMGARMHHVPGNLGSGGGWHRDSPLVEQFKALLYLSDVDASNGPFQYLQGSGRRRNIWKSYASGLARPGQSRFDKEDRPPIVASGHVETFPARAGTLLLVDTRGVHRGSPIHAGERYALTNYYFRSAIPPHIRELVNGFT